MLLLLHLHTVVARRICCKWNEKFAMICSARNLISFFIILPIVLYHYSHAALVSSQRANAVAVAAAAKWTAHLGAHPQLATAAQVFHLFSTCLWSAQGEPKFRTTKNKATHNRQAKKKANKKARSAQCSFTCCIAREARGEWLEWRLWVKFLTQAGELSSWVAELSWAELRGERQATHHASRGSDSGGSDVGSVINEQEMQFLCLCGEQVKQQRSSDAAELSAELLICVRVCVCVCCSPARVVVG